MNRSGIMALFKSMWRIGIRNENGLRPFYWRLLPHSLLINPRTLGEVVRLAIVGLHFRTALIKPAPKNISAIDQVPERQTFQGHYST